MKKIRLAPGPFVLPMPTVLIAATVNDVRNFIPVPFIRTANFRPVVVACGINPSHHTSSGISSNGTFSINLPGVDLLEATDWCGLHSGKQTDKSKVFKTFSGELENAPMLEACRLAAECRLITTVEFPVDTVYFGQVVCIHVDESALVQDGAPDRSHIAPLFFTFTDKSHRKMGDRVAEAWSIGREYKR